MLGRCREMESKPEICRLLMKDSEITLLFKYFVWAQAIIFSANFGILNLALRWSVLNIFLD